MAGYEFKENMSSPVIVAAACRNNVDGVIFVGARHFDMVMHQQIDAIYDLDKPEQKRGVSRADQGFIDQFGRFWSREDAFNIAKEAGQLEGREKTDYEGSTTLYSEDLY